MFDTSRLLNYLSKPIELPNSLWSVMDLETQPQFPEDSNNLEETSTLQTSGPTTPTPNCTKLQLLATMTEEIDTSLEPLTNSCFMPCPTSLTKKDIQPNTPSHTPSNNRIKLKTSSSNPHLRIQNHTNDQHSLYPAAGTASLMSHCSPVHGNDGVTTILNPFARNKKYSPDVSFDESLCTRRFHTNQSMPDQPYIWPSTDPKENYEFDLINNESPISTPTISPSTSPLPQTNPYDGWKGCARKEKTVNNLLSYRSKATNGQSIFKPNGFVEVVKDIHSTSSSDSDWCHELMEGLDFGTNDEWISTSVNKSSCHQNIRFSFCEGNSFTPPLPFKRVIRSKDTVPHIPKSVAVNTRTSAGLHSPHSLKLTRSVDSKNSKSESRLRRATDSIKNTLQPRQPSKSDVYPPRIKGEYQVGRSSIKDDAKNVYSVYIRNQQSSSKHFPTTSPSAASPQDSIMENKYNSTIPRIFLKDCPATITDMNHLTAQLASTSPKSDVPKRRRPDMFNIKTISPVNNMNRNPSGSKPNLVQNTTSSHLKAHARPSPHQPINLGRNPSCDMTTKQEKDNGLGTDENATKSCLSGLLSPTRAGLIPYPYRGRKKIHVVGNMQFDPIKMCWNSVDGNGTESNEEDPFAGFSSDEEDSVFPSNTHEASAEPVEEFIVGAEFQLSAHELRGMFKAEIEHKSSMQRWYAKADRCTNHDRIGLKDSVVRRIDLLDIRLTWPDRFVSKPSQWP